jgi:CRP/FNR family transcriptional regulator, cyclic AMP receptor protein
MIRLTMGRQGLAELARVPIFAALTPRQLRRVLQATEEYLYMDGSTIVREGANSEQLFVILDGKVRITRGGRTVARMSTGDFFGEISLLDGGPRTATVKADGPVRCLVLLRREFREILEEMPLVATKTLRSLATRLRKLDRSTQA